MSSLYINKSSIYSCSNFNAVHVDILCIISIIKCP
nr:MAG TPA: hypothetical protein [Caudoviricetes sp.]